MSLADTIVAILHALRESRRERDIYREIALSAIHRLHDQHVQIATQRAHIQRLYRELRDHRTTRTSVSAHRKSASKNRSGGSQAMPDVPRMSSR